MRIGIVCYPTYGGSGVVATELGIDLATRGHQVHFISSAIPFRALEAQNDNISFHEATSFDYPLLDREMYGLVLASKIVQVAQEHALDICHVHYAIPHAISAFLARQVLQLHKMKVVTTLHGTDITLVGRAPSFFPITAYAIAESDAVTTPSAWLRDETVREFNIRRSIEVVPNFVDVKKFRRGLTPCKRDTFAPNGEKIVLHVSNFRPVKRIPDVIETFRKIRKEVPAVLLMIGDGPERDAAWEQARELGIAESVRFLGKQEHIELLMSCADLFLLPSEYESFGLAALEAMACEIPCVTSNGGGLPEVITHEETGFLAPVGDTDAMAAFGLEVLRDRNAGSSMGWAARADVHRRFLPEQVVPRYLSIYERVADGAMEVMI